MRAAIALLAAFASAMLAAPAVADVYAGHVMAPKKQMDAGVMPEDVTCNEGLSS